MRTKWFELMVVRDFLSQVNLSDIAGQRRRSTFNLNFRRRYITIECAKCSAQILAKEVELSTCCSFSCILALRNFQIIWITC